MAKLKTPSEPAVKVSKSPAIPISGPVGVLLAFVGMSVLYADYLVYFGTDSMVSKIMLVPNVVAIAALALYKAAK